MRFGDKKNEILLMCSSCQLSNFSGGDVSVRVGGGIYFLGNIALQVLIPAQRKVNL